jgi:hypothetical protein
MDSLGGTGRSLAPQGTLIKGDEMLTFRSSIAMPLIALAAILLSSHPAMADEGTSVVTGKITLKGEPLAKGRIFFHLDNDQFVGAKIKNGEYSVERVPVGTWRITVEGGGKLAKYSDDEKTPLKVEVKKDSNNINLELK